MSLTLTWRSATSLPVDGSILRPETFRGLTADAAGRLLLQVGNRKAELGDLFTVRTAKGDDDRLTLEGDLRHVSGLARGMAAGALVIHGDAGPELGAEMSGGTIDLAGSAAEWTGAEMRGGRITVRGEAGNFLGAAYPGSRLGMREGAILVEGSAGADAGLLMRRGLIAIRGDAGPGLGRGMIAGTAMVLGQVGRQAGAGMKRGTLVLPGLRDAPEAILPVAFVPAGGFRHPFLVIYYRQLAEWGFGVPSEISSRVLDRYNGDVLVGGRGEVLAGRHAG